MSSLFLALSILFFYTKRKTIITLAFVKIIALICLEENRKQYSGQRGVIRLLFLSPRKTGSFIHEKKAD